MWTRGQCRRTVKVSRGRHALAFAVDVGPLKRERSRSSGKVAGLIFVPLRREKFLLTDV